MKVVIVGGPTAAIEVGGLRLLTDPTFSPAGIHETTPGRPLTKTEDPAVALDTLGTIDAVLLSHDQHADNLDPAGHSVVAATPLTLTTPAAAERLGGTSRGLRNWEQVELSRPDGRQLVITAVPARHGPPGCEPITGDVTGFVISGDDVPTIYVSGDNASLEAVSAIADRFPDIDLALLFAGAARTSLFDGAPLTLTGTDAATATRILDATVVIPVHVRGWAHFSEGPEDVRAAFLRAGLDDRLLILAPGQTQELL